MNILVNSFKLRKIETEMSQHLRHKYFNRKIEEKCDNIKKKKEKTPVEKNCNKDKKPKTNLIMTLYWK